MTALPPDDGSFSGRHGGLTRAQPGPGNTCSRYRPALTFLGRRAHAGVSDWVNFEVADATSFPADPGHGYDLVTFSDCLHDLGEPVVVLEARP